MNSQPGGMHPSLAVISELLQATRHEEQEFSDRTRAAVAMIVREVCGDLEVLFIERAHDERDPWSGHLAFPGGKVEPGEQPRQAAERETREEIGLDLQSARYIGQLPDIVGANLPVKVSCFIFMISGQPPEISANAEVNDVFWVSLTDLRDRERHTLSTVRFSETSMQVPAIILPQPGKPVLWGITYRLIMYLLEENRERREYW